MEPDKELDEIRRRKMERLMREASKPGLADGEVNVLTDSSFDDLVGASRLPVLVDFWAAWCGPCRMVAPIVESLAKAYAGRVSFGKVDVDANPRLALKFNVQSIPTLILFSDGRVVERTLGAQGRAALSALLDRHLNAHN